MAAYRKLKITIKYFPTDLPSNKNPIYNVLAIDINDKDLDENLGEDIIVALVKETREEEDKSAVMAVEMYQDL